MAQGPASTAPSLRHNHLFLNALVDIKPNSDESTVQMLWETIAMEWFPPPQGYRYTIKPSSQVASAVNIRVSARKGASENRIFFIHCKMPGMDREDQWDFARHIPHIPELQAALHSPAKFYAALAIGTKVKFYMFDGQLVSQHLRPLQARPYDLTNEQGLAATESTLGFVKGLSRR
ncbi:hypothetical protein AJ80_01806 [Polytolypa hystricis UAMH7299]|uniref:Uncharacterized protein n=1 Tax=Polytolypa hystricis (strain UAMH7299) TaxID=1447883 RepID=A0A2B7Z093_POLH7|nr:hypothetical protein AJ80_01806 [Polytolypa hystricis UAMH7299]